MTLPSRPQIDTTDGGIGTWVGFTGLGFGVIILYAAVKGVSVFGKDGIVTNAITKGQLTHVVNGKTTTSGGKSSGNKFASGFEQALGSPGQGNQALGSITKSVGNSIFDQVGLGGLARGVEGLPIIGRIINDNGNIFQAAGEIGQNAGRATGQGIGHALASAAKDTLHGAESYLHSLKGLL